ncbi:MAG: hypothetical protein KGZ83_21070 [Sulfuricella sp.]|nr:hypothetical protein [Sulfuricella sp.]
MECNLKRKLAAGPFVLLLAVFCGSVAAEPNCTICKDRIAKNRPLCAVPPSEILSRCGSINGAEQAAIEHREAQAAATPEAPPTRQVNWDTIEREGLRLIREGGTEEDIKRWQAMLNAARASDVVKAGVPSPSSARNAPQNPCGGMYCD